MAEAAIERLGSVSDTRVWRSIKLAFLASALIFLVTITLGFLNAVTAGELPRWQILVHLHSGTLGWITLSTFGAAIWMFSSRGTDSDSYATRVRWLVWLAILSFLALIASFGIAASQRGNTLYLLAGTAPIAVAVIWATAILIVYRARALSTVSSAEWLMAAGLVTAAIATTMGMLMALSVAEVLPLPPGLVIIGHVIAIEGYLFLVATAMIEWVVVGSDGGHRSGAALLQGVIGILVGLLGPAVIVLALVGVSMETLGAVINLGLLAGIVLYGLVFLARIGPRALRWNPLDQSPRTWMVFATIWTAGMVLMWPLRVALGDPSWWILAYAHIGFVGVLTNTILGVLSARTAEGPGRYGWAEPVGMWLLNIGIVVFLGLEIAMDVTHGAWIMGAGLLLVVLKMILSLQGEAPRGTGSSVAETTD